MSAKGVEADPKKVRAMIQWPVPTNIKDLRCILGLTRYYRRFVADYGTIAAPLSQLLKKTPINGQMMPATKAFERLKHTMITLPILALSDIAQAFVIEIDVSGIGLGVVLSQNHHIFQPSPVPTSTVDICLRARVYGRRVSSSTVEVISLGPQVHHLHRPTSVEYLLEQQVTPLEYQRWMSKLLGYDFEIQYSPKVENKAADALDATTVEINALTTPVILNVEVIKAEVEQDPYLIQITS